MFPKFVVVVTKSTPFTTINSGSYPTAVAVPENTVLEYACADTQEQADGIANALISKHRGTITGNRFGEGAPTIQAAVYPAATAKK